MKTKKILCTLMAVMCIGTAALTGCGSDSDSSTANSANSAAAAQTNESVDVTAVADKLKDGIEFKDELAELDEAKIEKIIGISADSYTKAKVYVSSSGGTAEEIDRFYPRPHFAKARLFHAAHSGCAGAAGRLRRSRSSGSGALWLHFRLVCGFHR